MDFKRKRRRSTRLVGKLKDIAATIQIPLVPFEDSFYFTIYSLEAILDCGRCKDNGLLCFFGVVRMAKSDFFAFDENRKLFIGQ